MKINYLPNFLDRRRLSEKFSILKKIRKINLIFLQSKDCLPSPEIRNLIQITLIN